VKKNKNNEEGLGERERGRKMGDWGLGWSVAPSVLVPLTLPR